MIWLYGRGSDSLSCNARIRRGTGSRSTDNSTDVKNKKDQPRTGYLSCSQGPVRVDTIRPLKDTVNTSPVDNVLYVLYVCEGLTFTDVRRGRGRRGSDRYP